MIATLNELHFWDWSQSKDQDKKDPKPSRPFCKVSTKSDKEKVRYVKFDSLGHHLITGSYTYRKSLETTVYFFIVCIYFFLNSNDFYTGWSTEIVTFTVHTM